jgi:hypothetical protein
MDIYFFMVLVLFCKPFSLPYNIGISEWISECEVCLVGLGSRALEAIAECNAKAIMKGLYS